MEFTDGLGAKNHLADCAAVGSNAGGFGCGFGCDYASVLGVLGGVLFLTAFALVPVVGIVRFPLGGECMLMELTDGLGAKNHLADCTAVGSNAGGFGCGLGCDYTSVLSVLGGVLFLAAFALVPVVGIIRFPIFGEGVLVFKLCNLFCLGCLAGGAGECLNTLRGLGGLGGYLAIVPLVSFLTGSFGVVSAGSGVPVVGIIFRPFVRECMSVFKLCNFFCLGCLAGGAGECLNTLRGLGGLGGYLAIVPLVSFLAGNFGVVSAGSSVPVVGIIFRPFVRECVSVFKLCNLFCFGCLTGGAGEGLNALRGFGGLGGYLAIVPLVSRFVADFVLVFAGGGVPMVGFVKCPLVRESMGVGRRSVIGSGRRKHV